MNVFKTSAIERRRLQAAATRPEDLSLVVDEKDADPLLRDLLGTPSPAGRNLNSASRISFGPSAGLTTIGVARTTLGSWFGPRATKP